jgi:polysaccharide pyruvyl transferase CsaB
MSKYLISGYYGKNNIGDEAILSQILNTIRKCDQNAIIEILSYDPSQTQTRYNLQCTYIKSPMNILKGIIKCDYLIYGGGGHEFSNKLLPLYVFGTSLLIRILNKKVIAYAIGVEQTSKKWAKQLVSFAYNNFVDLLLLRDEKSKKILQEWGVHEKGIVTCDPVMSFEPNENNLNNNEPFMAEIKNFSKDSEVVGVCFNNKEKDIREPEFAMMIDHIMKSGQKVVLVPMCLDEGDVDIVENLEEKYANNDRVYIIKKILSQDELFEIVKTFKYTISMRFHLLIFSALAGVPFIALSNSIKVKTLNNDLNQINLLEYSRNEYTDTIDRFVSKIDEYKDHLVSRTLEIQKKEQLNLQHFKDLVNHRKHS